MRSWPRLRRSRPQRGGQRRHSTPTGGGESLRVLLVSPLPPPTGGISQWTSRLLEFAQGSTEFDLDVVDTAMRSRGIHQLGFVRRLLSGVTQTARVVIGLIARLAVNRPHVAHVNTSGSLGLGRDIVVALILRSFRVPFVVHIRFGRVPALSAARGWEWRLLRRLVLLSAGVITLDATTRRVLEGASSVPVVQIPNFLVDPGFDPGAEKGKKVTFVGWVSEAKGVGDLLAAWELLGAERWTLQIIGPGDEAYLAHLLEKHPWAEGSLIGELANSEVLAAVGSSAILTLPSHTEGFPNVVAEGMALGCGVVATSVGAIPEMLADDSGIVVPVGDHRAIANALGSMMHDSGWARYGARARRRFVDNFEAGRIVTRYVQQWEDVRTKN